MTEEHDDVVEDAFSLRLEFLQDLVDNAIADGRLEREPELIEQAIKLFTPPPPKHSKQRTYAIRNLEIAEYKRARVVGEVPKVITEEQILAEMASMEKEKKARSSKKDK